MTSTIEIMQRDLRRRAPRRGWCVVRSMTTFRSMVGGIDGLQLRQQGPDAVHGLDDVGARLAEDDDDDRRACRWTRPALRTSSTESVTVGDVGEPHGRAVAIGDDQRLVLLGLAELVGGR